MLDQSPSTWVPTFLSNSTVIRPAQHRCTLAEAISLLRTPSRPYQAYIRHQSIEALPRLQAWLQPSRAMRAVGERVQMANLWLGDGRLSSALHFDMVDNLLLQLRGEKLALLLPPSAIPRLSYAPREEFRHVFDGTTFVAIEPTGEPPFDNLSPVPVVAPESLASAELPEHSQPTPLPGQLSKDALQGSLLCRVRPGEGLFIPALWSHAVISLTEQSADVRQAGARQAEGDGDGSHGGDTTCAMPNRQSGKCVTAEVSTEGLNAAVNIWYVRGTQSVDAALSAGLDRSFAPAHAAHGAVLSELGRQAEAARAYDRALAMRHPTPSYDWLRGRGSALLDAGLDDASAERSLRAAVALRPAHAAAQADLGRALRSFGRFEEASTSFGRALATAPDDRRSLASLAACRAMLSRYDEAAGLFARVVALDPSDAVSHHALATALEDSGRPDEALSALRTAVELKPTWQSAQEDLKNALSRSERRETIRAQGGWSWQLERSLRSKQSKSPAPTPDSAVKSRTRPDGQGKRRNDAASGGNQGEVAPSVNPAKPASMASEGTPILGARSMDELIGNYLEGKDPHATPRCLAYLGGDRRAVARLEAGGGDGLAACAAEFRRATNKGSAEAAHSPMATEQVMLESSGNTKSGRERRRLLHWDELCASSSANADAVATAACTFSAKGWSVGRTRHGSWDADLEPAATLASPDALATAQVIIDARELRFVRHNATFLARGVASGSYTPGMTPSSLPWHVYAAQQGLHQQLEHANLPLMKMAWDLALLSTALAEMQPQSIIELGTGSGASAMWLAEEAAKHRQWSSSAAAGLPTHVHTFDLKRAETIAAAVSMDTSAWHSLMSARSITFHGGADLSNAEAALPTSLLASLPHPWLIIEDSHAPNMLQLLRHLFGHMKPGDYMVVEDIRLAGRKRADWFALLSEAGDRAALDLKYMDFFGVNACCAPDGWMKKVE